MYLSTEEKVFGALIAAMIAVSIGIAVMNSGKVFIGHYHKCIGRGVPSNLCLEYMNIDPDGDSFPKLREFIRCYEKTGDREDCERKADEKYLSRAYPN